MDLLRRCPRHRHPTVSSQATLLWIIAAAAAAGMACSDATGPTSSLTVTVSIAQHHGPDMHTISDTVPSLTCSADVQASASGTGSARWSDAIVRWYGGIDASTVFDSLLVSEQEVQSAWGKPEITAGEVQTSVWTLYATLPFRAIVEYHYKAGAGVPDTATFTLDCGPIARAGTAAPSVTALTVMQNGDGDLEPGDTLSVEYTTSSTVGLWETAVVLSGPCDVQHRIADSLRTKVTRTVRIRIPASCGLGIPITVGVVSWDAALQSGSRAVATDIALVDTTPPTIRPLFFRPEGGFAVPELGGDYFEGDSIKLVFHAADNHRLRAIVWKFLPIGVTDSLIVTDSATFYPEEPTLIPIPAGVTGPLQLRLYARDAVGLTSDTVTTPSDSGVLVYPTIERPTRWTTVTGEVRDAAIDTRRGVIYLLQTAQHQLTVLSLTTMAVTATVPLPYLPIRLDLSESGDTLVMFFAERAVGIIDVQHLTEPPRIVQLPGFDTETLRAAELVVTANGKAFVSPLAPVTGQRMLVEVDLATGAQRTRTDAGDGGLIGGGGDVARSLDHSVVVLSGGPTYFQRYDAGTDSFGPRLSAATASSSANLSVDATGQRTAIGFDVYGESLNFLRTVNVHGSPSTALSAAGDVLYEIFWPDGIVRASVDDGRLLDRTPNPIRPQYLRVADDGTLLVTIEHPFGATTSKISVIDMR